MKDFNEFKVNEALKTAQKLKVILEMSAEDFETWVKPKFENRGTEYDRECEHLHKLGLAAAYIELIMMTLQQKDKEEDEEKEDRIRAAIETLEQELVREEEELARGLEGKSVSAISNLIKARGAIMLSVFDLKVAAGENAHAWINEKMNNK